MLAKDTEWLSPVTIPFFLSKETILVLNYDFI